MVLHGIGFGWIWEFQTIIFGENIRNLQASTIQHYPPCVSLSEITSAGSFSRPAPSSHHENSLLR